MTFHIGETLNVGYYGVKVVDVADLEDCEVTVELACDLGTYRLTVPLSVAEVQRVIPAEGEPQPRDIWADRNKNLWFAAKHWPDYDNKEDSRGVNADGWRTVLVPEEIGEAGSPKRPEDVNQDYGPMTLVYREPSAPGQVEPAPALGDLSLSAMFELGIGDGVMVTYPEWNDGEPVKVLSIEGTVRAGTVAVRYTFPGARDGSELAFVPVDTLVTPYRGAQ